MTSRILASQRLSGNGVLDAQIPPPPAPTVAHEATLGQVWQLPATIEELAEIASQWSLEHTVSHQSWLNQRWALTLSTLAQATFVQRWDLKVAQVTDADLTQSWGLIVPAIEEAGLDQAWALDAFLAETATLNQRYRLETDVVWQPVITAVHYTLILTGVADTLSDLVLPMSSFQGRLRSGSPSYLAVVIPAAAQYSDAIDARPNGQLVVSRGDRWTDGLIQVTEIARVNLETIRLDQGARSSSATLSGHRQTTNSAPKTVTLGGAQVRSVAGGLRRYRCALDNDLRAGDTAEINGESLVVREISYVVGPELAFMEIAE